LIFELFLCNSKTFFTLFSDIWRNMHSDSEKSANSAGELTVQEQEAVDFFLEYKDMVQFILRNPNVLKKEKEWSSFLVFLRNLDSVLCKSSLDERCLLFRGIARDYAERLLFLLDITREPGERSGDRFTPHILQDPSYITFSRTADAALEIPGGKGTYRLLFVYQGEPADNALPIAGKSSEVLFPRNARWLTTGYMTDDSGITCVCLERIV
jgi:hypothetical protein